MALRFGLFGTGFWAAETSGAALAAHPDATLVGVWGRDPAKAAALAGRFGVRSYDDVDALLSEVDAVAVALPPDVQADVAVRAAEAGRHLLLDKPLAFTLGESDRIVAAVRRHRLASLVFFTNRFFGNVEAFLADTVRTGGWDGARATMFASIFQPGNPYGASPWRRERGGLWDIGPHALSVLLPVLGPVERVAAIEGRHQTTHLLLEHNGGAASALSLTLDAPPAATMQEFVFYGSSGVVAVPGGTGTAVGAFGVAVDQLVRAAADAAGGAVPEHPCDVRFGREVVAILVAADAARRLGRTVPVDAAPG
ncbi:MAG TPA: Gfo/Idh/MocA family oxidoreductase [Micromonosporaceae bacterium]|nr:Gfo/Idh/MocA family oxidoreductase [Micromonosporaceae bacterium]